MARLLDTNTRYFDNEMTSNQIIDEQGSLIKILDEVLVNGSTSINAVMIKTIEDPNDNKYWVSTITLSKTHPYKKDLTVVEISGSSESVYNGIFRVQEISSTTITIAFDKSIVTDRPPDVLDASGTSVKIAPLGYTKVFTANNKAVYKSANPLANKAFLRVDDSLHEGYDPTWSKRALVSIFSDMKSIDDYHPRVGRLKAPYIAEFPVINEESSSGRYGIAKWFYKTGTHYNGLLESEIPSNIPTSFEIIGDSKTFYFIIKLALYAIRDGSASGSVVYSFGEYTDYTGSTANIVMNALEHNVKVNENYGKTYYNSYMGRVEGANAFSRVNNSTGKYMLNNRALNSTDMNSLSFFYTVPYNGLSYFCSGFNTGVNFNKHSPVMNFVRPHIHAETDFGIELAGEVRGYYMIMNDLHKHMAKYPKEREVVDNIINHPNKKFVILSCYQQQGNADIKLYENGFSDGRIAFELSNWS